MGQNGFGKASSLRVFAGVLENGRIPDAPVFWIESRPVVGRVTLSDFKRLVRGLHLSL
jgi:hypothetical protein